MDSSSTLIGLILLFLFIGPVVYFYYNLTRIDEQIRKKAKEHSINPDVTGFTPVHFLCLDLKLQRLLVIKRKNRESNLISLRDIAKCELKTVNKKDLPGKLNEISVLLFYKKSLVQPVEIIFFDEEDYSNSEPQEQLQQARKWERLIKYHL